MTYYTLETVSVSSGEVLGDSASYRYGTIYGDGRSISSNGRYVVFASYAGNLVAGDTNGHFDVFVRDILTGTTSLVSTGASGQGNADSLAGSISADGRYVVFRSEASNLVAGDTNGSVDIFLRDLVAGTTTIVSTGASGQGNSHSGSSSLSADGRYVAFQSDATNLVGGDTNASTDIFVRDVASGTTTLVSTGASGMGNAVSNNPSISDDGRYVAFSSFATNLVAGDTNGTVDVFVRDLVSGTTTLVSTGATGQGNSYSYQPSISSDGRYVAFVSGASNLVTGDTNGAADVFVRDLVTGTTTLVSVGAGAQSNADSHDASISGDGRYVAFSSSASNLVAADTNAAPDIFVRDLIAGTTTRVSSGASGQGDNDSFEPSISTDGSRVVFTSFASNLAAGDTNGTADVFVASQGAPVMTTGFNIAVAHSTGAVGSIADALAVLGGVNQASLTTTTAAFIDFGSGGSFGNNVAYPGGGGDNFAVSATGYVTIPTSGTWTFGTDSDDGVRVKVDGHTVVNRDVASSGEAYGAIYLTAGTHYIELTYFEASGGEGVELYAAQGSFTAFDSSMKLVGDTGNGGLAVATAAPSGFTVQTARSSGTINSLATAEALLAGAGQIANDISTAQTINFGGSRFGNDQAFAFGSIDNFAIKATGEIDVTSAGVWTFGTSSDDGVRLRIDGVEVLKHDNATGAEKFGTVELSAGKHTIELVYFEAGGGEFVELFAAQGTFTTFNDTNTWHLIGDTANGGLAVTTYFPSNTAPVFEPEGLVAHYAFDGNANDSVSGWNGTPVNNPTYTTGEIGQGLVLNNSTSYVQVAAAVHDLPDHAEPRTVAFWANPSTFGENGNMISWGDSSANGRRFSILQESNNHLKFIGQSVDYDSNYTMQSGWQHIAVSYDGSNLVFYVNGTQTAAYSGVILDTDPAGDLFFGRNVTSANNEYWGGTLDDVRIFDRALTAGEVAAVYGGNSPPTLAVSVQENTTAVATLTATDPENDPLTYSIAGGADQALFSINESTGALSFKSAPDFESPTDDGKNNVYDVQVQVSDGTLTDVQNIAVTVTDVVENQAPTAINLSATSIAENNAAGATVATLTATDPDSGDNHTFSLVAGTGDTDNAAFTISGNELKLTASADYETKSSYSILLRATDQGGLTYDTQKTLTVTDVNEAPTAVTLTPVQTSIAENADVSGGVKVATIAVTDDALGSETLALTGADSASFEIRNGNELWFKGTSPNFEAQSSYEVAVTADDTTVGATPDATSATFTLTVTDVNEAPTAVTLTPVQTSIAENADVSGGVKVATIAVTDDALGSETLALTGADSASFEIRNGNELWFKGASPDFEAQSSYQVAVTADDTTVGGTPDATSATFTLSVTNVNEAPANTLPASFSVAEDTTLTLSGLSVADPDAGTGTITVTLSVASGEGTLSATAGGGVAVTGAGTNSLQLSGTLADINAFLSGSAPTYTPAANANGSVTLTMTTNDGGSSGAGGALSDTDTRTITVTAVNDAPVATGQSLSSVAEDSGVRIIAFATLLGDDSAGPANESGQSLTITAVTNAVGGTAVINGTNIEFTPAADFNGTASFDYTIRDNGQTNGIDDFKTATASVSFGVWYVNDAPVATDDTLSSIAEDSGVRIISFASLTGNDSTGPSNESGQALTITALSNVVGGTAVINGTNIEFTPTTNFNGTASFDYTVSDNGQTLIGGNDFKTDTGAVSFSITAANDAPVAVADTGSAGENEIKSFDVLTNDTDVDAGDSKALDSIGTVTVASANGSVNGISASSAFSIVGNQLVFTPGTLFDALDFDDTATVTVNYTMKDGQNAASSSTLTLTVNGANDTPVAVADTGSAGENEIKSFDVLANDTDVDAGDSKALDSLGTVTVTSANSSVNGINAASAFTIDAGQIKFTPGTLFDALDFDDTATVSVGYTMKDGQGAASSSTLTLKVNGANDTPVAVADTGSAGENETKSFDVLANDTDVDAGDGKTLDSIGTVTVTSANGTVHGIDAASAFSIDAGQIKFTPGALFDALDFDDSATVSVGYTMKDGQNAASSSTLTLTVNGANDTPVAVVDPNSAGENETKSFAVLANDTDVDTGDSKTLASIGSVSVTSANGTVHGIDAASAFTIDAGQIKFTPGALFDALDFDDTATVSVGYTMKDGQGAASSSTLTLTVNGANDTPVAVADTGSAGENETKSFDVLANDTDVDAGDGKTLDSIGTVTVASANGSVNGISASSAFSIVGNQLVFTPGTLFDALDFDDTATVTVNYTMKDGQYAASSSTLTLTVNGANDTPVAVVDPNSAGENETKSFAVLANDTDVDTGDSKTLASIGTVSVTSANGTVHGIDAASAFTIDAGQIKFTPGTLFDALDFDDTATVSVGYTMKDGQGAASSSMLTLTVNGANDTPVAVADTGSAGENETKSFDVLANDTDVDVGDTKTLDGIGTVTVTSANGSVNGINAASAFTIDAGQIKFTPGTLFDALDFDDTATVSVGYTMKDGQGAASSSTLTLTVNGANDAPTGAPTAMLPSGNIGAPYLVDASTLLQGFDDADSTDILHVVDLVASNGTVMDNGDGTFSVTPDKGFNGGMTLTYSVDDGNGGTFTGQTLAYNVGSTGGDDAFVAGTGNETIDGGRGSDAADYSRSTAPLTISIATLRGYAKGADTGTDTLISIENIIGGSGNDTITGSSGANRIDGGEGHDTIKAGSGNDEVVGGGGNDAIHGGNGDDLLDGGDGDDTINGEAGNDTILGREGGDTIAGGSGNDTIDGGDDDDVILGDAGNDLLMGGDGSDKLAGGAGDDKLMGGDGIDVLDGGAGNDTLYADGLDSGINGGAGTDTLIVEGTAGMQLLDLAAASIERVYGSDGGDDIFKGTTSKVALYMEGLDGADELWGGSGADVLSGGDGLDILYGGAGNDLLDGGLDADQLWGGIGNDTLMGGAGADWLQGGAGSDQLYGGADADVFVFGAGWGRDTVHDFQDGVDKLLFSGIAGLDDFGDLRIATSGSATILSFGTSRVTLLNTKGQISADDMSFG